MTLYPLIRFEDMPLFYKASDVIVIPSRLMKKTSSDRSPNVALEALASGRILLASYVGGIPDIVGNAGILIKPNDPMILAKTLAETLTNLEKYRHLERLAIMRAKKRLDMKQYTLVLLKLALEILKRKTAKNSR